MFVVGLQELYDGSIASTSKQRSFDVLPERITYGRLLYRPCSFVSYYMVGLDLFIFPVANDITNLKCGFWFQLVFLSNISRQLSSYWKFASQIPY